MEAWELPHRFQEIWPSNISGKASLRYFELSKEVSEDQACEEIGKIACAIHCYWAKALFRNLGGTGRREALEAALQATSSLWCLPATEVPVPSEKVRGALPTALRGRTSEERVGLCARVRQDQVGVIIGGPKRTLIINFKPLIRKNTFFLISKTIKFPFITQLKYCQEIGFRSGP